MLAIMLATAAGIRVRRVPLPWPVRGVYLRCPMGQGEVVLAASHLGCVERQAVVERAILASERGSRAEWIL